MPHLNTFGIPVLVNDDNDTLLPKGKPLALLAYCATDRRRRLRRDECAALLWSDMESERARHSVRQVIWRLRKVLGEDFITRDDLIAGIGPGLTSDREQFLEAVHGDDAERALELYAGPYLDGMLLPGGDEFDDWLQFERHRLEEALVQVVERAVERALQDERRASARDLAEQLFERTPRHVGAHRLLVEALLATGDTVRARQEADALETLARTEGMVLPTRVLHTIQRTRQSTVSSVEVPPDIALDFVGRDAVFSELLGTWGEVQRAEEARIVVITGAAGIGKSRLLQMVQRRCAGRKTRALLVRANPGEQGVRFGFASALVRALGELPGALGVSNTTARELVALDPSLSTTLRVDPAPWDANESPRRRALALVDLLQAITEQQPLALLVDDWHWMDPASRELLTVALGRCPSLPLLVVVTSRPGQEMPALDDALRTVLAPLSLEDSLEALRSTGAWPALPEVTQFLTILATASRGIPLELYERLTVAMDAGALRLRDGEWSATSWDTLANEVVGASPLARRLAACTPDELNVLRLLTVAGAPLTAKVLQDAVLAFGRGREQTKHESLDSLLALLESRALVRLDGPWVMLSHDTVADGVHEQLDRGMRQQAHTALATALEQWATDGDAIARIPLALRHALWADDPARSGRLLARLVPAARARGDARAARAMLVDLVGDRYDAHRLDAVLRAVPWWQRSARPSLRSLGVAAVLLAAAALVIVWRMNSAPSLVVLQAPTIAAEAWSYGADVYRPIPALTVATQTRTGAPVTVRVRARNAGDEVVAGAMITSNEGVISLASLRVRMRDTVALLQVSAEGHRPLDITVRRAFSNIDQYSGRAVEARLIEASFGQQRITSIETPIRVTRGTSMRGTVQLRYASMLQGASVWVAYTPTWGDPEKEAREVSPVLTPTLGEIVDIPVSFVAAPTPGRYWLLVLVVAEPSGGFALSGTNWTLEKPDWNDGNEVARLPSSAIERANRVGTVERWVTVPDTLKRSSSDCRAAPALSGTKQCLSYAGLFGIPVIVE